MKKISILCLNCFGIPISFNKKIRFKFIAKEINRIKPDLVMLQEVEMHSDKNFLFNELNKLGWQFYSKQNGLMESGGLIMMSKTLELKNLKFHKFTDQGPNKMITMPDKILGKGFQSASFEINGNNYLVINTHLVCPYARSSEEVASQQRQFKQLTEYVKKRNNKNIILAGDLNAHPGSEEIKTLLNDLSLRDNLNNKSYTVDPKNLNRVWLMNMFGDGKPYRTDYVLTSKNIRVDRTEIVFKNPMIFKDKKFHLSDHFGIIKTLQLK